MIDFKSEQEAARAILGEAALVLQQERIDYVVLGGWIPLLFHANEKMRHPGSFDVDVLLSPETTRAEFDRNVVDKFKGKGYMLAAKNKFQLFKPLPVNGEQIIFHIDLLHTNYAPYQDKDDFYINWGKMQSISGPGTDIIFSENERITEELYIVLPDGSQQTVAVNFANEIGFLSAKGRALISPKRKRDSYDIYMVISQSKDLNRLIERSYELYNKDGVFRKSIDTIAKYFFEGEQTGVFNVIKYLLEYPGEGAIPEEAMGAMVEQKMRQFLDGVIR